MPTARPPDAALKTKAAPGLGTGAAFMQTAIEETMSAGPPHFVRRWAPAGKEMDTVLSE
jgi:hypothetical protein